MSGKLLPFNISLLEITPNKLSGLSEVKSLDIFEGKTNNFHNEGLYSTLIFGKIGDEIRDYRYAYINTKVTIFNPLIFYCIGKIKSFFLEIMAGKKYANFDKNLGQFIPATELDGETGFHFFMKYFTELKFEPTVSKRNQEIIRLVEKSIQENTYCSSKIIVMPAGLRDIEYDESGRVVENEINDLYRKILSISNIITETSLKVSPEYVDSARFQLQITFYEIYMLLKGMIEGKNKLIMKKWASRQIYYAARNVLSAQNNAPKVLGDKNAIGFNDVVIGLFQYLKSTLPVSLYDIRNGFLSRAFLTNDGLMSLTDPNTLKRVEVNIKNNIYDLWASNEGVEKLIERYSEPSIRHKPIMIEKYYLGLTYLDTEKGLFKFFQDISELPKDYKVENVHPISLMELFYASVFYRHRKIPNNISRYPIAGLGSLFPSTIYLMSTVTHVDVTVLNEDWEVTEETISRFPIPYSESYETMSPHGSMLSPMKADFDGDVGSQNPLFSEEAVEENFAFLRSKKAYLDPGGKVLRNHNTDLVERVVFNLCSDVN